MKKNVPGLTSGTLERFVRSACRAVKLRGAVSVLLTSSREMQTLNRRFLGKDGPTDVLSFPAEPGSGPRVAGDLAISVDIAAKSAKQLGHAVREEVKILVLHGVLHLAGYDHETDGGRMAKKEDRLRRALKLPGGLILRTQDGETRGRS